MVKRIFCPALCRLAGKIRGHRVSRIHQPYHVVCQDMFQKKMEGMAMVLMAQMAEFMKENIVLKDLWQTHYVEIQIDV